MTPESVPIPHGSVVITPTQVYEEVRATRDAVNQLRAELAGLTSPITDHETRIRSMERRIWLATGVAAGLGAGAVEAVRAVLGA